MLCCFCESAGAQNLVERRVEITTQLLRWKLGLHTPPEASADPLDPVLQDQALVYRAARPHLAFFCRLEINEAAGGAIPARFRLGGHTYWQENLRRR